MTKKLRIAFCFSGQARTLDQTYQFFQKNLFDAAKEQGFDYDVFCAVEDDEDSEKVNLLNPTKIQKIRSDEVEQIINKKYGDFSRLHNNYYILYEINVVLLQKAMYKRYLQQYYKVKKSIELKKKHEEQNSFKYDIVVRLRFDIGYDKKRNFKQILKDVEGEKILCCKLTDRKFTLCPIGDFFFVGNSKVMDIFGQHFDQLKNSFKNHEIKKIYHPLVMVTYFFDKLNYICHNMMITNYLIRAIAIINTKLFFRCYCVELIIYDYLAYYNININLMGLNCVLYRKNGEKFILYSKNSIYEIN